MILIIVKISSRITLPTPAILSELSAQRVRLEIVFSHRTKCFSHRDYSENIYRFSIYNYSRTIYCKNTHMHIGFALSTLFLGL